MIHKVMVTAGVVLCFVQQAAHSQSVGLEFYDNLADLPYTYRNVESRYISSYDRKGGNDDGFRGTYSALYVDDKGEHVLLDEEGPGCVYNLWFTDLGGPTSRLQWGKLRFYFDNEPEPRIGLDGNDFFSGRTAPFLFPLVTHNFISSGGYSCSMPFPFSKHLKITTEKRAGFYNIYYQQFKNVDIPSWSGKEDYSRLISLFQQCGSNPKPPGGTDVVRKSISLPKRRWRDKVEPAVLLDRQGGGTVQAIRINPLFPADEYALNHIVLRMTWDERDKPDVDAPIGPFFGSGLGEANVRSLFFGMSPSGTYYCYFPMPFRRSARIELLNTSYDAGAELFCEIEYTTNPPPDKKGADLGYFAAHYRHDWPIVGPEDYTLLEYEGRGSVVGQVMTIEPVKPDRKRWWEGDLRIWLDGEDKPRFHGTGHEDEYHGGWSSFWLMNPYTLPLVGQPKSTDLRDIFGQINGSATVYRIWPGGIPFRKSIRFSHEHGDQNDTPANYASVVFYYVLP